MAFLNSFAAAYKTTAVLNVMQNNRKQVLPLVFLFIFLNAIFLTFRFFLEKKGIDSDVLIAANALLFLSNFITLLLQRKALKNSNPNVFVRSMMAGTIIKLFIIAGAFVAYIVLRDKNINKPAVFISIFLYFIYLAAEVTIVLKMNKQKNA
jgi:hypothetical protein